MTTLINISSQVINIAKRNQWHLHPNQPNEHLIRFIKNAYMIDVWPGKMTVGTYLNHPKMGKTAMFRRNVSFDLLDKIFKNPRQHTGIGYRRKKATNQEVRG